MTDPRLLLVTGCDNGTRTWRIEGMQCGEGLIILARPLPGNRVFTRFTDLQRLQQELDVLRDENGISMAVSFMDEGICRDDSH